MMKILLKAIARSLLLMTLIGMVSCDETTDDATDEEALGTTAAGGGSSSTQNAKSVAAADSLDDLNISSALNLTIPAALSGAATTSLALSSHAKSMEACEIGRNVKEGLQNLGQVAGMFCHFEAEPDKIPFGEKINLTITGEESRAALAGDDDDDEDDEDDEGGEFMSIWIDDSSDEVLKVWFCQGDSADTKVLSQLITLTGKGKGSVIDRGSRGTESWENAVKFDLGYTDEARNILAVGTKYARGSDSFKRQLILDLATGEGVSSVKVSNAGSWEGSTHSQEGAARMNSDYGQALFKNSGTHENQEYNWVHRAFFNSSGFVVGKTDTSAFGAPTDSADSSSAGALYVFDEDVPKKLPDTYAVESFPADAWDCVGDIDSVIDMANAATSAAHAACEVDQNDRQEINCWGEDFEQSNEDHDIDESKQEEGDKAGDFDERSDEDRCEDAKRNHNSDEAGFEEKIAEICSDD